MKHLMKKAVKAAVFAALTTLALTAFASAEGEMAIGAGCTTGTSLRMRSEPNTSSAIVTTLNKSVAVALLDDSVPGWYKINYNGSTGLCPPITLSSIRTTSSPPTAACPRAL